MKIIVKLCRLESAVKVELVLVKAKNQYIFQLKQPECVGYQQFDKNGIGNVITSVRQNLILIIYKMKN